MLDNKEETLYAIVQEGICIWGLGSTIPSCIEEANNWFDSDQQITGFEDHDHRGNEDGRASRIGRVPTRRAGARVPRPPPRCPRRNSERCRGRSRRASPRAPSPSSRSPCTTTASGTSSSSTPWDGSSPGPSGPTSRRSWSTRARAR